MWAVFNWGVRFMELYKRRQKRIEVGQRLAASLTCSVAMQLHVD